MIAINYAIFALIATCANLLSQELVVQIYSEEYSLPLALFFGTAAGLLVKYYLDKKFIFNTQMDSFAEDVKTFYLYTLMGLLTTAMFWLVEIGFDHYSGGNKLVRYSSGAAALCMGYWMKYHLDKKFVFKKSSLELSAS